VRLLTDATDDITNPRRLAERLDDDGYIFLRQVLPLDAVNRVAAGLRGFLAAEQIITSALGPARWSGRDPGPLGPHPAELHALGLWEAFVSHPGVHTVMATVLGDAPLSIPIAQYQFKPPTLTGHAGPISAHQDHFFNPGLAFRTFWVPLMAIDDVLGGLTLAPRYHRSGWLHDAGRPGAPLREGAVAPQDWARANYDPGDVVVFAGTTPHGGLPNRHPDLMRLSVDVRAQASSAPRPAIGVVLEADDTTITVDDSGLPRRLRLDSRTVLRTDVLDAVRPCDLVGRRAIVAQDGNAALLVRLSV
jgi:hypothetical protein